MQTFSVQEKQKFDSLFWNKSSPSQIEKDYMQKTIKYIKYIKWIPGLQMIGVWNSLSMNWADRDSDIDLFIVSAEKRMWLVRIFCTLIFQILGVRKTWKHHAWRFCLSFFCTREALDFWSFALEKDPYLYFWILYFKPLLDYNNTYNLFLEKNSSWSNFSKFDNILQENKSWIQYINPSSSQNRKLGGRIIDSLFKKLFLSKTLKHYKKLQKPFWVIINNNMLKFHDGDIRKNISAKF